MVEGPRPDALAYDSHEKSYSLQVGAGAELNRVNNVMSVAEEPSPQTCKWSTDWSWANISDMDMSAF